MTEREFYEQVDKFFAENKIREAENFIIDVLNEAEDEKNYSLAVSACNELGGFYRAQGKFEEGMPLYEKALYYLKQLGAYCSPAYSTTLINYATFLGMAGQSEKALEIYGDALEKTCANTGENSYEMATIHNNMSFIYQNGKKYSEAVSHIKKAISILENLENSRLEIGISYSNLAQNYSELGELEKAENYGEMAVEIIEEISGDRDVHFSSALSSLSGVKFSKGEYKEAEALLRRALALVERDFGKDSKNYQLVYDNFLHLKETMERQ